MRHRRARKDGEGAAAWPPLDDRAARVLIIDAAGVEALRVAEGVVKRRQRQAAATPTKTRAFLSMETRWLHTATRGARLLAQTSRTPRPMAGPSAARGGRESDGPGDGKMAATRGGKTRRTIERRLIKPGRQRWLSQVAHDVKPLRRHIALADQQIATGWLPRLRRPSATSSTSTAWPGCPPWISTSPGITGPAASGSSACSDALPASANTRTR